MRPANALNYRVMSDVGSNCEEHNYKGEQVERTTNQWGVKPCTFALIRYAHLELFQFKLYLSIQDAAESIQNYSTGQKVYFRAKSQILGALAVGVGSLLLAERGNDVDESAVVLKFSMNNGIFA